MMNRSHMERGWMVGDGDVVDGSGVVEGRRVVHNRVVGLGVVHGVVGLGVVHGMVGVGVVGVWDWVAVLVQPGLGGVRVLQGVGVQGVEGHGLAAVNLVPELAGELVLVEEGAVGTDEAGALRPVPTVVTDPVGLTA